MAVRGGVRSGILEYASLAAIKCEFCLLAEFGDLVPMALNEPCLALAESPRGCVVAFSQHFPGGASRRHGGRPRFFFGRSPGPFFPKLFFPPGRPRSPSLST